MKPATAPSAERAILGAILHDSGAFFRIEGLREEDFYDDRHRSIWRAMVGLATDGSEIDLVTVHQRLVSLNIVDNAGGIGYLSSLADELPNISALPDYVAEVVKASVKRGLLVVGKNLTAAASKNSVDPAGMAGEAEQQIRELTERLTGGGGQTGATVLDRVVKHLEFISKGRELMETGFTDLDWLLISLEPGDLILLAARPSVGKTALACNNIALNVARTGKRVAIFSLEMSAEAIQTRNLARESRISFGKFRHGKFSHEEWSKMAMAKDVLSTLPIVIDDSSGLTPSDLLARCRKLQLSGGLGLVIVDYLQLMSSGKNRENQTAEVTAISKGLKAAARSLKVPIIALSQLSRANQSEKREPALSDLRDSGALEQDADVVIFLHRDAVGSGGEVIRAIVAKHRNGPTGTRKLMYLPETLRFENYLLSEGM